MAQVEIKPQLSSQAFVAPDKILVATDLTDIDYLIPLEITLKGLALDV